MPKLLRLFIIFSTAFLIPRNLLAWKSGELLIWMDSARARGLQSISKKFEKDFGIKVTTETPENITFSFPTASVVVGLEGFGMAQLAMSIWKVCLGRTWIKSLAPELAKL